jgi:uncharacterized protein
MNKSPKSFLLFLLLTSLLAAVLFFNGCFGFQDPNPVGKSDVSAQAVYGQQASQAQGPAIGQKSIVVTGQAKIKAVPDAVIVRIHITTTKETSVEALQENMFAVAAVTEALQGLPISDLQIETAGFHVQALTDKDREAAGAPDQIYAYSADTVLEARTSQIEKIGAILSSAIDSGATEVPSLYHDLSRPQKSRLKEEVLSLALDDALFKAQAISASLALEIESIQHIREISTVFPGPFYAAQAGHTGLPQEDAGVFYPAEMEAYATLEVVFYLH